MRSKTIILILAVCSAVLVSCEKSALEITWSTQAENIDKYIQGMIDKNPDYPVFYNDGVVRLTLSPGEGAALEKGGTASIWYAGYTMSGSSFSETNPFATNIYAVALNAKWTVGEESDYTLIDVSPSDKDLMEGLRLGLEGVRPGEDCYILFPGKKAYGKRQVGTIPANSALVYHIQVEDVRN